MLDQDCSTTVKTAFDFWDAVGMTGVLALNLSYARLQYQRDYAKTMSYSVINLVASLFLVASLLNKFNIASFTGNVIWTFMSVYGVYRCWKYKRRAKKAGRDKEETDKDENDAMLNAETEKD